MKKDRLIKTITLGTFILLLAGYIVFKTGGLETFFERENDSGSPQVKADSTQPTMQVDMQEMGASDTSISIPVPPLPTDAYGFKPQPVQVPPPPLDTYRADPAEVQIQVPIHDSFYLDVISMSSKSSIMVDQSKWIWKLDSLIGFDSTEVEE